MTIILQNTILGNVNIILSTMVLNIFINIPNKKYIHFTNNNKSNGDNIDKSEANKGKKGFRSY